MAATTVGLVLAQWCVQVVTALRPPSVPIPTRVALDRTVLLFTGCTALAVAAVCALAPALRSWRDLTALLQAAGRRTTGRGRRTRELLVIVETALSVALVAVCALLVQSLSSIQTAPLGFDAANVFTLQFRLPPTKYRSPEQIARFFKNSIDRVRAVPGVESAALVRAVPFSGNGGAVGYALEGRPAADPASAPQARFHLVTPDYFRTLRIPVLKGRDFTDRDDLQSPLVAVVNETFARRAWPGEEPLGQRITTPQTKGPVTIVGVVGDAKHYTATEPPMPQLYASHYQVPLIFSSLVARTTVDPMSVTNEIRRAVWSVDKDQPVWAIRTLEAQVEATRGSSRFLTTLLAAFAAVALLLATVGIYGVTSYGVAQRTREIGIRVALGASARRVVHEIVGRAMKLTLVAVIAGLLGAVAVAWLVEASLFGVKPADPLSLGAAAVVLGAASIVATYVPARRAARVDPVIALAEE
jgi:putative ABC transport system permease protein